jgi:hypothetical protein
MNDAISTDLKENPKRFWAAIKSKKQESTAWYRITWLC